MGHRYFKACSFIAATAAGSSLAAPHDACTPTAYAEVHRIQNVAAAEPEVRELTLLEVDKTVLENVRTGRKNYSFVVDDKDHVYAVEGPLGFSPDRLPMVAGKGLSEPHMFIAKETGALRFDAATKKFEFEAKHDLDLTHGEREAMLDGVHARNPGANLVRAERAGTQYSQVLGCAEVLSGQLNGKNFQWDRLWIRHTVAFLTIGGKAIDIETTYADDPEALATARRTLYLSAAIDSLRRTVTTPLTGVVGKKLIDHNAGAITNYVTRFGTSVASNYAAKLTTDFMNPLVKRLMPGAAPPPTLTTPQPADAEAEAGAAAEEVPAPAAATTAAARPQGLTPQVTQKIFYYNTARNAVAPMLGKYFDKKVLQGAPMNVYEACRKGSKMKIFMGPRMMRFVEGGTFTLISLPKYFLWGV